MTHDETLKILAVLKAAYPQFYKGMKVDDAVLTVNLWEQMLSQYDYPLVAAAVQSFIATDTKGFPPVIGVIVDKIVKLTTPEQMTEVEAWGYITKALKNSLYGSQKEFDKLPEEVKSLIQSPSTLKEWAMVDTDELQTVIQSNFMRSYRAKIGHIREHNALPESVEKMLSGYNLKQIGG